MPSVFYLDYVNGLDATTGTPLGWWSVAYTGGTAPAPAANEVVTGAISGKTAKLTVVVAPTGGSWAGGDAAGTMYFYGKSGAFAAEQVNCAGGGHFHIAADFVYCAWKTFTLGATLARIAPGDIIRIAKSGIPVAIGNATWTNLSKTITLAAAQTLNIDRCEADWTVVNAVSAAKIGTDWKEGTYAVKVVEDATPGANEVQAYSATGVLNLSAYQKLSFWIKNEVAVADNTRWIIKLYTTADASGAACDEFIIPAIPSTGRWMPLTIARTGGGNLNAAVASIALVNGAGLPTASKYIYLDNIIACTTDGLNLQSLISKNGAARGGTEGFYGIQSINGVTVLLDSDTNTLANAGRGYSGTTELIATYIRETIKTDLAASSYATVQAVNDSGSVGNDIQYQGGYNNADNTADGETFFDGLNGNGSGISIGTSKSYNTLNYLSVCRYCNGFYFTNSYNNTITTLSNANNNSSNGVYIGSSYNNTITTLSNANNNSECGVYIGSSYNNTITTLSNANNNSINGVYIGSSYNNTITTLSNANNNSGNGVYFGYSYNNTIRLLSTTGNTTSGVYNDIGVNYIYNASIAEATEVNGYINFANSRIFSQKHDATPNNHWIFTDGGTINSEAVTRVGASGLEWKFLLTSANRNSIYPLTLSIAKIAVAAGAAVTVTAYLTKSHATNVAAKLVCRGGQIAGVPADVVATKADDTNPEQLTITFTPTEAGTVEIEAWAYYVAANGNVLVDTIGISQA